MTPVPTPRTDEYVEAWDRVNGYDFGPIEKGPYRHGIERMRQLERELTQAAERIAELERNAALLNDLNDKRCKKVYEQSDRIRVLTELLTKWRKTADIAKDLNFVLISKRTDAALSDIGAGK